MYKLNKKVLFSLVILIFFPFVVYGQDDVENSIKRDENGQISFVDFRKHKRIIDSPDVFISDLLKVQPQDNFECQKDLRKRSRGKYDFFQQYYNGLLVEDGGYSFHYLNGNLIYAHGHYIPVGDIKTVPSFSIEDAKIKCAEYNNVPLDSLIFLDIELLIKDIPDGQRSNPILVYKLCIIDNYNKKAEFEYLDANSGKIVYTHPLAVNYSSVGTFQTVYSGSKQGTTDYNNNTYHLYDSIRNIHTWNLNGGYFNATKYELSDNDNNWTSAEHHFNNNDMALDVHWVLQKIYDRLKNQHGIFSFDNDNHPITAHIKYYIADNACWVSNFDAFYFGEGQNIFDLYG